MLFQLLTTQSFLFSPGRSINHISLCVLPPVKANRLPILICTHELNALVVVGLPHSQLPIMSGHLCLSIGKSDRSM